MPLDEDLLTTLSKLSHRQRRSRSALIREACRRYIEAIEKEEMDRLYEEGYRRLPETAEVAETQEAVAGQVLGEERW